MTKHQTQDPLADFVAQAEQALESGDQQAARQIWEALLQIDPEHPVAREGLARLGQGDIGVAAPSASSPPEPAAPPAASVEPHQPDAAADSPDPTVGGLDLELDLDLLGGGPSRPAPAEPAAPAADGPAPTMEGASVRELLEAAEEIDPVAPVEGLASPSDTAPSGSGTAPEVLEMVARARDALADGDTAEATRIASRALAMDENAPGADEILEQARSLDQLRADRAEYQLRDAIVAFEQGDLDDARARFEAVLEAVPGHTEARDYLEKIEAARLGAAAAVQGSGPALHEPDLSGVVSIPLGEPAAHTGEVDAVSGPPEEVTTLPPEPTAPPTGVTQPPPPPLAPSPEVPGMAPAAPAPAAAAAASTPPGSPVPARSKPAAGRGGVRRGLVLGLVLVGLLAASWYAVDSLGLLGPDRLGETIARSMAAEVRRATASLPAAGEAAPPPAAPEETSAPAARGEAAGPDAQDAGVGSKSPRYTRRDVPRLLARARAALRDGNEASAVELLTAAQQVDPTNFELLEELERARDRLGERQDAEKRLAAGRAAFERGNYEEALRLFYRVPQRFRPANLDLWIATGWYNLGVLALQARSASEAQRFFSDCLELDPQDEQARRHREVARRYRRRAFDDAYGLYVSNLQVRPLP